MNEDATTEMMTPARNVVKPGLYSETLQMYKDWLIMSNIRELKILNMVARRKGKPAVTKIGTADPATIQAARQGRLLRPLVAGEKPEVVWTTPRRSPSTRTDGKVLAQLKYNNIGIMEMARLERALLLNAERLAERSARRTVHVSKRPPWNPRPQPDPLKYIPPQLDRPVSPYSSPEEKRKAYRRNMSRIYSNRVMKPEVLPKGYIPKSFMDRQIRINKTNMLNKNMKDRLLNVKSTFSSFRENITPRQVPFYTF